MTAYSTIGKPLQYTMANMASVILTAITVGKSVINFPYKKDQFRNVQSKSKNVYNFECFKGNKP